MNPLQPPDHMRPESAERQLVGAVLRDPDLAIDAALLHIEGPADFYFHPYRLVFEVCRDLFTKSRAGGPVYVHQELVRRGSAADLGASSGTWLADLYTEVPTGANVDYHAGLVREAALRRRLWHAAREILHDTESPPTGALDEALSRASSQSQELLDAAAGRSSSVIGLQDLLNATLAEVDARRSNPAGRLGVSSGFELLDGLIGGFRPGQLIVFGARPGVGKTAWLLAMLARYGGPCFFACLEMPRQELGERL